MCPMRWKWKGAARRSRPLPSVKVNETNRITMFSVCIGKKETNGHWSENENQRRLTITCIQCPSRLTLQIGTRLSPTYNGIVVHVRCRRFLFKLNIFFTFFCASTLHVTAAILASLSGIFELEVTTCVLLFILFSIFPAAAGSGGFWYVCRQILSSLCGSCEHAYMQLTPEMALWGYKDSH